MKLIGLRIFLFLSISSLFAQTTQESLSNVMTLDEYLGYVKQFHPLVKQANLIVSQGQANLLQARGGFDPKIEVDFDRKQFKSTEYFSVLNSTFKVPTWYGIEIKAGFEQADGAFLNPEFTFPDAGLVTLGIAVPLGQGLIINQRMADLRKAKFFQTLTVAERDLEVARVLFEATVAYANWYRNYQEYILFKDFLRNAEIRYDGIRTLIREGDRPRIDSVEAGILVKSRRLGLEQSRIKLVKSALELSNFLWTDNGIPLELQDFMEPEPRLEMTIEETLQTNGLLFSEMDFANHPKIIALENKVNILRVDKQFKGDLLKPRLDFNYNYLSEPVVVRDFNWFNYKYGINFSYPLFTRKERGGFRLAKFKLQDAELDLTFENIALRNKIDFQLQEIGSLVIQMSEVNELVSDFQTMLNAEERLFFFGESSIFLINAREDSLLSASLRQLDIQLRYCNSHAELFNLLARPQ